MQLSVDGAGARRAATLLSIDRRWPKAGGRRADGVVGYVEENRRAAISKAIEGAAGADSRLAAGDAGDRGRKTRSWCAGLESEASAEKIAGVRPSGGSA